MEVSQATQAHVMVRIPGVTENPEFNVNVKNKTSIYATDLRIILPAGK